MLHTLYEPRVFLDYLSSVMFADESVTRKAINANRHLLVSVSTSAPNEKEIQPATLALAGAAVSRQIYHIQ